MTTDMRHVRMSAPGAVMYTYTVDHHIWIISSSCKADMTKQSLLDNCA